MHTLGLQLAPGWLAAVSQQVVLLAESLRLDDKVAGYLIALHMQPGVPTYQLLASETGAAVDARQENWGS